MVSKVGAIHDWYRFLDAHSDDEAVSELRRHESRIEAAYAEVDRAFRALAYSPGGEVDELLVLARSALGEATELLEHVAMRFRAGEHAIA